MFTLDLVQIDVPSIYPKPAGGPLPYRLAWAHPSLSEAIKAALAAGSPDYFKGLRALKLSWGLEGGDALDTKTQRLIACLQAELARGV